MWMVIGGSGFGQFKNFEVLESIEQKTPFGSPSAPILRVSIDGTKAYFLSRHGAHHRLSPSLINYRANIFAAKQLGVTKILSISAVGSLREEIKPGDCVISDQYIDRTKSIRAHTFVKEGLVSHVSLAEPVDKSLIKAAKEILSDKNIAIHFNKTHVCIEGPAFSTRAESLYYRQMGADIIGMTNFPEYALAREAGIVYFPMSFVTDYDCWKTDEPHVDVHQVIKIMKENNQKAYILASSFIKATNQLYLNGCKELSLAASFFGSKEALSQDDHRYLEAFQ